LLFAQTLGIQGTSILITSSVFLVSNFLGVAIYKRMGRRRLYTYAGFLIFAALLTWNPRWLIEQWKLVNPPFFAQLLSAFVIGLFPAMAFICFLPVALEALGSRASEKIHRIYALELLSMGLGWWVCYFIVIPNFGLEWVFYGTSILFIIFATTLSAFKSSWQPATTSSIALEELAPSLKILAFVSGFIFFANEMAFLSIWRLLIGASIFTQPLVIGTALVFMSVGIVIWGQRGTHPQWLRKLQTLQLLNIVYLLLLIIFIPEITSRLIHLQGTLPGGFSKLHLHSFMTVLLLSVPFAIGALPFTAVIQRISRPLNLLKILGINTIGSLAGLWIGSLMQISFIGSSATLLLNATLLMGTLFWLADKNARAWTRLGLAIGIGLIAFTIQKNWDWRKIWNGGANYLDRGFAEWDQLLWQEESFNSGFVSVAQNRDGKFLLFNGMFQGNDTAEVIDQYGFSLIPHLFAAETNKALNIGFGVGGSASLLARMPFDEVHIVEIAPRVPPIARQFFSKINSVLFENPKVQIVVDDGRRYVARSLETYSLISMEVTNMWLGGAQNLYTDEFYKDAKRRLQPQGVLQQWIQLHNTTPETIAITLRTLRNNFEYVELWIPYRQGVAVASDKPLNINPRRLEELRASKLLSGDDVEQVLKGRYLSSENVDCFLKMQPPPSTDSNQILAYRGYQETAHRWNLRSNLRDIPPILRSECPSTTSAAEIWLQAHPQIDAW